MNIYPRISTQSTNKLMYTHWNQVVLCTKELSTPLYIGSRKHMMSLWWHHGVWVMKGFPTWNNQKWYDVHIIHLVTFSPLYYVMSSWQFSSIFTWLFMIPLFIQKQTQRSIHQKLIIKLLSPLYLYYLVVINFQYYYIIIHLYFLFLL